MTGVRQLALAFLSRDLAGVWTAGGTLAIGAAVAFRSDGSVRTAAVAVAGLGVLLLLGDAAPPTEPEENTCGSPAARRAGESRRPPHSRAGGRGRRRAATGRLDARRARGRSGAPSTCTAQLRKEARSILIDRPGTGWSDPGPFPRTTDHEAGEVLAALEAAGEEGPFVLAGHSFGGLLFAAVARRSPRSVAALLLLDATPPDTIVYGPPIPGLARMRWRPVLLGSAPALRPGRTQPSACPGNRRTRSTNASSG